MRSKVSWHVVNMAVSVLFVFKGSRRELLVPPGRSVCDLLTDELKKTGNDATVCVGEPYEPPGNAKPPIYLLQRWSEKWQAFLDVSDPSEIFDGDKLSIIPKPGLSPAL